MARDNTVAYGGLRLQLPQSPLRPHYVKAHVRVHQYPDGGLAVFHGPRAIARYTSEEDSDRGRTVQARRVTRFDVAAQQALWICGRRKEALPTSSTTPTAAANGSGQMMCYQNRTSPSAIDTATLLQSSRSKARGRVPRPASRPATYLDTFKATWDTSSQWPSRFSKTSNS